ncbi:zinc-dependent alcohol dehydrogenase [Spiribacter halobius]|uniref:Dehydrogenase n=1 Tax=Sediminicurvatus halobius TaxID=2182432 RepID=A0A2U2N5M7_9GAMM|nr:zinc-binding alcohol dehydrogenase [Spiribacter halobius]PWG64284.1 dehydrogenase [Spiribacter halobius]UEX79378.1 zinc-binding alcohol dehydrogenase [Spiribacter halobius]
MAETAYALWITAPGEVALRRQALADPGTDEVLVRTLYTGVSRGTEALVYRGGVPESQHAAMRAPFQEGDFPAPVKYGYASVGIVEAGPEALRGRTVFCLHPHQDRYVVPVGAARPLPPDLPPGRAVLAANVETAVNGLWDAAPRVGERIVIIGAGVVGCLVAALCASLPGSDVQLVDVNPARAALAGRLGVPFSSPDAVRGPADRVLHASGSEAGLRQALALAGNEGEVVELSWFGDREISLPLGEGFHARRLTLRASQVGQIAAAERPRWDHARRLDLALALLACHPEWEALIDGESDFADLPQTLPRVLAGAGLCHRVRYPAAETD